LNAITAARSGEKFDQIQRCMMRKEYHYTGTCQGEIPSRFPACQRADDVVPARCAAQASVMSMQ